MLMAHVGIVTGAHLCRNPRVVKEGTALREAGHRVTVLGPVIDDQLYEVDRSIVREGGFEHQVTVDLRDAPITRTRHRLIRRMGIEAVSRLGWERPEALGYGVRATLIAARDLGADLTIGHQEVGAYVACSLMNEGYKVGADIEDWYSEDLPLEARVGRPVELLRRCEAQLVRHGRHVTTTSKALASALAQAYDGPEPTPIYNAFPWAERTQVDGVARDRANRSLPSLHWVSQTIGPGRGLETLCEALHQVSRPVEVHLRGRAEEADMRWMKARFPSDLGHRLVCHDLVPPSELLSRIAEHDIGLALENCDPPSRDLTVTNKIMHYLVAGLAVVATDTKGQREIARAVPEGVKICRGGDADGMARQINTFVEVPEAIDQAKAAALDAARKQFCWERQVPVLLASVDRALAEKPIVQRASIT